MIKMLNNLIMRIGCEIKLRVLSHLGFIADIFNV